MPKFKGLRFTEKGEHIIVTLYRLFEFTVPKAELLALGEFKLHESWLEYQKDVQRKLLFVLGKHIHKLRNRINGNAATYIHEGSGIPLVGNSSFGIVDRGSSLLELKPITSCNLNCIYCSLSEGQESRWHDFVVEQEYLVKELIKIVKFKQTQDIEIHIGCQGEPLLYAPLVELVSSISGIKDVSIVSMDTNAVMLTQDKAKELYKAGMNRFNISLNGLSQAVVDKMAGRKYPLKHVLELSKFISKMGANLVIAPVWVPGINDAEIPKLIELGKELKATMGIQNFLEYKHGRKPAHQESWELFYAKLKLLEKKHNYKLKLIAMDLNIRAARALPKPFQVGDVLKARILCPGRYRNEAIVAAKARNITVITPKTSGEVRFKILRTKHNIYLGKEI